MTSVNSVYFGFIIETKYIESARFTVLDYLERVLQRTKV